MKYRNIILFLVHCPNSDEDKNCPELGQCERQNKQKKHLEKLRAEKTLLRYDERARIESDYYHKMFHTQS